MGWPASPKTAKGVYHGSMRKLVLAFALVPAVAAAQYPSSVGIDLTTAVDLHDAFILYTADAFSASYETYTRIGDLAAGTHTLDLSLTNPFGRPVRTTEPYAIVAASGASEVVVSLNVVAAAGAIGNPWESVFPGVAEADVYQALTLPEENFRLRAFYGARRGLFPAYSDLAIPAGQLVKFSDGASVGTVQANPVPEPASMVVLGLGALATLRRRARRS